MIKAFLNLYTRLVLYRPRLCLAMVVLLVALAGIGLPRFHVDASGDSLLLESDTALDFYRQVRERYGTDDFIVVTYEPKGDLFSDASLATLGEVVADIEALEQVRSVTSMLNVPLFESPPVTRDELSEGSTNLLSERTDRELARQELQSSPLYANRLVSEDGRLTAIQVNLSEDQRQNALLNRRASLLAQRRDGGLNAEERESLKTVREQIDLARREWNERTRNTIYALEEITGRYSDEATLLVGGIPAINVYMLDYIRQDLMVFGIAMLLIIVVILSLIFGKSRWVFIPLAVCAASVITMAGVLGLANVAVTAVSSNFMALMLILTLSLVIHLAVRYRELRSEMPHASQRVLVRRMVRTKFLPSVLTALTTMVAFGSLVVSDIRPVIDFGWMMVAGLTVAFLLTFLILPPALMLVTPGKRASTNPITDRITGALSSLIRRFPGLTVSVYALVGIASVFLMLQLSIDNRFVDYYRESTDIHRGLEIIDTRLGGTTPLEIILDAEPEPEPDEEDAFLDEFLDMEDEGSFAVESYWYNPFGIDTIGRIHEFLESRPAIGSVESLDTTAYVLETVNEGELDSFALSIAYKRMPDDVKSAILDPYLSEDGDQARIATRIYETRPELDRTRLLEEIREFITDEVGIDAERVQLTGIFVLYNNVLQSLVRSQVYTAGTVVLAIALMFLVSFRSFRVATLAIIPNALAAVIVLGIMKIAGLPLDVMTITIAAVAIGIGVDNTIHYVHRYMSERPRQSSAEDTIAFCHANVGRAMYFTSLVIALGFSILALSQFMPTVYFGLLTGTAMLVALLANLTLLPLLLARFRAFEN